MQQSAPYPAPPPRIILTGDTAISDAIWDEQRPKFAAHALSLQHTQFAQPIAAETRRLLAAAHFLVVDTTRVGRAIIDAAVRCVAIIRVGDGYDNIDVDYATEQGIICCNQPGIWSYETAEYAFLLGLMQLRKITSLLAEEHAHGGTRPFSQLIADYAPISTLRTVTVGIVGFGRIGQEVCRLYGQQCPRILIHDTHTTARDAARFAHQHTLRTTLQCASLPELISTSDIITLHIPMRAQNRHLLSDTEFAQMKPTAIVINCARGELIDSDALHRAVTKRSISAALDIDTLPHSAHNRILATPHFAWYSDDAVRRMSQSITDTVITLAQKRMPSCALNVTRIPQEKMRILQG